MGQSDVGVHDNIIDAFNYELLRTPPQDVKVRITDVWGEEQYPSFHS
jgi:hypothetical protein